MVSSPTVSVIMNCYNGAQFLREAIDSIYQQTFDSWEIIFFDNASTDASSAIAHEYDNKLCYFRREQNVCLGEARNMALKLATGKYVAFLDCDDLYLPQKLEHQVNLMESQEFAMCYGGAKVIDQNGEVVKTAKAQYKSGNVFGKLLKRYEINMQSVMIRSEYIAQFGLSFPEDFEYGPDYDLFMDIASRARVGVIRDPIVKTRLHAGALSHKKLHRVKPELESTLRRLVNRNPELATSFASELQSAHAKLAYYEAISLLYQGDVKKARAIVRKSIFGRWELCVVWLLINLPLPPQALLRLLGR